MKARDNNKQHFIPMAILGLLMAIVALCTSCIEDDTSPPSVDPPIDIKEYWSLESQGLVLETDGETNILYSINTAGCLVNNPDIDLSSYTMLRIDRDHLKLSRDLSISDLVLTRLNHLPEACGKGLIAPTNDPTVNFDFLWNLFQDHYAFFELREVDWAAQQALRTKVSEDNIVRTFESMLCPLEDGHVNVEGKRFTIEPGIKRLLRRLNTHLTGKDKLDTKEDLRGVLQRKLSQVIKTYLGEGARMDEEEVVYWGILPKHPQIAYINFLSMGGYGIVDGGSDELGTLNRVLDEIMEDLEKAEVTEVIIDVRFNQGGLDRVGMDMASRFFDQKREVFSKKVYLKGKFTPTATFHIAPKGDFRFTKNVFVLTGPVTASAAEVFAMSMAVLPHVTFIGENTEGIFSDVLEHPLPNGASVGLSNEVYSSPDGTVFEGVGIGPDKKENKVPFLITSDFENETDGAIERVIASSQK